MARTNIKVVNEMKNHLNNMKKLTLEHFVLPTDDDIDNNFLEDETNDDEIDDNLVDGKEIDKGIESDLMQIRKIALNAINRYSDRTVSTEYEIMKKIWSMVDKTLEQLTNTQEEEK